MKKRKRLCIIFWDLGLGGIQKRVRDLTQDISRQYVGWDVYILLRRKTKDGFDNQIHAGRIFLRYYPYTSSLRMPLGFVFWVGWQMIKLKPDVILTFLHALSAVVVVLKCLLFWIPSKIVLNEGVLTSRHLAFNHAAYFSLLIRLTYPRADKIVVPTNACKDDLVKKYYVPATKITVIPNWTCLPSQKPVAPAFDCLYVGRFHQEKSPLSMVRITKLLAMHRPTVRVGMMGNGELLNALLEAINTAKLSRNIQVLPFSRDVANTLRRTKILVVPSFAEGMPNVVLEAAMCRVPSVINHFPGAEEVVQHGKTGYISETEKEAAKYIYHLLTHEQERKRLGAWAQQYVAAIFSRKTQKRFIEELLSG